MKNIKTKIILSAIILLSVVGFVGTVNAAGVSLYVSPASITKTAGTTFNASVGLTNSGSKVCAVEGTLVFNGLSCQSITIASDVMAQSSPTCSNPYFLIGIPNCTTLDKTLLTVLVKAGNAGTATISLTGVDIIGEGASVGSVATSGSYTINAAPVSTPKPTITTNPTQQVTQPTQQTNGQVTTPAEQTTQDNNLTANVGAAALAGAGMKWYNYFLIVLVAIIILYGIYYFAIKRKKK
ncbi:MAG: hypothetical protein NT155_04065 [Candidatus Staskawiczbacteria bacterium]|nr:hypothetical protein [Candidatus Staskawiczbacteria bacterium]